MSLLSYSAIVWERKTKDSAWLKYFQHKLQHLCYDLWDLHGFITSPSTIYVAADYHRG